MGITFDTLKKRLLGELDVIPASSAGERINDALRDLYDSNDWGFLFQEGFIRTPALISGYAEVTEFSNEIVLDATTKAIVDAITIDHVPIEERQFRILSPRQTDRGVVYQITAYDNGTGILTIDPPFMDVSNSAAKIEIFKRYYTGPQINIGTTSSPEFVIDFKRFDFIVSSQFQKRLGMDESINTIDRYDPWRSYNSDPRLVIARGLDSSGNQLYEFYPTPRFERILRTRYVRKGRPLVRNSDQAPDVFSLELILAKAKEASYRWAIANSDKANVKNIGKFQTLIALINSPNDNGGFPNLLQRAIKADEELYPKAYLGQFNYPYYDFDLDAPMGETLLLNF